MIYPVGPFARLRDIPQLTRSAAYRVNVAWHHIEGWIARQAEDIGIDTLPDFQRGHVWTDEQRSRYIEFRLRGGNTAKDILWNSPNWLHGSGAPGKVLLVDGLQRLTAAREWVAGRLAAFGKTIDQYPDPPRAMAGPDFIFQVNDLPTRAAVLNWYLELNGGGTPHAASELERVALLLAAEPSTPTQEASDVGG